MNAYRDCSSLVDEIVDAKAPGPDDEPVPRPDHYGIEGDRINSTRERKLDLSRVPLTLDAWLARDLPEPDYLMGFWLTTSSRALIIGSTGLGKTNFLLALSMHCAAGREFLHWRGHRAMRVLYVDGEMSRRLFKERIADAARRLGETPLTFHALSHEDVDGFAPLNTPEGQRLIEGVIDEIGGVDLLVLDSVMCLTAGNMRETDSWAQVMPWVKKLTKRNIAQIWAHHTGHDDSKGYGDKTREWQLDTVAHMTAVEREGTDVSFEFEFRKARERTPANRADFQTVRVALMLDEWQYEATEKQPRRGRASPMGGKFLDALKNVLAGHPAQKVRGKTAARLEDWRAECETLGLIDKAAPDNRSRARMSKYRAELIAANMIACERDLIWTL